MGQLSRTRLKRNESSAVKSSRKIALSSLGPSERLTNAEASSNAFKS